LKGSDLIYITEGSIFGDVIGTYIIEDSVLVTGSWIEDTRFGAAADAGADSGTHVSSLLYN